ncbi:DUF2231 domain-containing protein [Kordiimonas laminariae]|uniref:DUF2231 domain-containing protein n=1 Tax=Kordiimonas laminariae TaxID=2917717 RepID=UPI001FF1C00D|nr:DUF2231 domain-containing protein [Kordiimonas laminariae]MCK0071105.1 DUF2231 domain-containing protein [Kordiimonas laminariae]
MDNLIIPNWHPFLVHFTVGLILSSTFFMLASKLKPDWQSYAETAGKWTLWLGAIITAFTLWAGFDAYSSVAHDDIAHKVMKVHRLWALVTAASILLLAFWVYKAKTISNLTIVLSVVVSGLVGVTGYLGAELVYRHGVGVMRLPDTSGEGHAHADGASHDHGDTVSSQPQHDHGNTSAAPKKHDHGNHEEKGSDCGTDHENNKPTHDHGPEASGAEHDHGNQPATTSLPGKAGPAEIASLFFNALQAGDVSTVSRVLADDVVIIEGEHAQLSKASYMNGHMKSDMAFLPNLKHEILSRETGIMENIAWVTTFSRLTGSYKGKEIDRTSREFLVLQKVQGNWYITLIQWADK